MSSKKANLRAELQAEIKGVILLLFGLFGIVSSMTSATGILGNWLSQFFRFLTGDAAIGIPLLITALGIALMVKRDQFALTTRWQGIWLAYYLTTWVSHLQLAVGSDLFIESLRSRGGGLIGGFSVSLLLNLIGSWGLYLLLGALLVLVIILIADISVTAAAKSVSQWLFGQVQTVRIRQIVQGNKKSTTSKLEPQAPAEPHPSPMAVFLEEKQKTARELKSQPSDLKPSDHAGVDHSPARTAAAGKPEPGPRAELKTPVDRAVARPYRRPPIELLQANPRPRSAQNNREIADNAKQLENTLDTFGVKAKVSDVSRGPTITRYELQVAPGTKVAKIVNLSDDLALNLAAENVRIEAPIPGKSAIGVEVPNRDVSMVYLRDVIDSKEFRDARSPVAVALGKDIAGETLVADLAKMPHLLIAGATGSGKSVCINCIIASLLYRSSPDEVKLILVDPKVVEMNTYNGIPHLIAPVVTDPKKAAGVLRSVTREMEKRYELFAAGGVKDIVRFNERVRETGEGTLLSYWVVIVDELADLIMVAKEDVEDAIIRIAQLARAAGIHLVLGTQRPSADVITGLIKANIPSRIAFAVASGTDSRIILDGNGAEKLLGKGDMLFHPIGASKPIRAQGAFISEQEVEAVVAHVKLEGAPEYDTELILGETSVEESVDGETDELFAQAARLVVEAGQASVSYLQRRLKVGHSRAGRIMDQLAEHGVVGENQGSKPREVLMTREQLENYLE
ncbi:MAG: DNA translocase FtsK 4TM domain-containing protein [Bacillota bacterium]